MDNVSIKVNGIKKHYRETIAVDGISFEVQSGSIFGMLGPNGAGKTTTIEMIIGLVKKDEGDIDILGYSPDKDLDTIKRLVGVQLQIPSLYPRLKVTEILSLFASFYENPMDVNSVIQQIGLEEKANTLVKNLSGGQKHRLAIGLAIVGNGKIVFLDEPTIGLDPQTRRQLWLTIKDLKSQGKTIFLTTHYMDEAEHLCDDLVIIDKGKVIAQGSPKKLIDEYTLETAVEFNDPGFSPVEKEQIKALAATGNGSIEFKDGRIAIYSSDIVPIIQSLLDFTKQNHKAISDMMIRKSSLEDVFLKLTGRELESEKNV